MIILVAARYVVAIRGGIGRQFSFWRLGMAILMFVLAAVLWIFLLGWVIHLWAILDAALWKPKVV